MLSRRHLLMGSGCALAAMAARSEANDSPDVTVLNAGRDGFNGAIPGPAIRVRQGDEVRVKLVNGLDAPMALCWHGVRAAAGSGDDGAAPLVAPGGSVDYRFTVPDAGVFWYRAARLDQQQAGMYGALVVAERTPPEVDQEHVLVFDSRPGGGAARQVAINGSLKLDIAVRTNERLRLRFINASAAMLMNARVENHQVLVMALDGEPAEPFISRDGSIILGPGNRADVFVDATMPPGSIASVASSTMPESGDMPALRLVYGAAPARSAPLAAPAPLPANPLPERIDLARALRVTLPMQGTMQGTMQSGSGGAPAGAADRKRPPQATLFTAERGRTVVMALDNRGAAARVVYLGGHHFRLLDRLDDGWKPYWLDTITVAPGRIERIAFAPAAPGHWRIEDRGVDGAAGPERWFEVK